MVFENMNPEMPNENKKIIKVLFWLIIVPIDLFKIQEIKIKTKIDFERPIVLFA